MYLDLTREFNAGRLRCIISSGQAVVLHHLAVMSKDGDWIVREDSEALEHILTVLAGHNARYRFGAPLDTRWTAGGWSSHFEFQHDQLRVRTDFVTRPPRIARAEGSRLWHEQEGRAVPFLNPRDLAEIKKTNREKDYAVIGELARLMPDLSDRFLYSRSARDLVRLAETYPQMLPDLAAKRPLLNVISEGRERLEEALDAERRALIHANEERLKSYLQAAEKWARAWPEVAREIAGRSLLDAHEIAVAHAEGLLPFKVQGAERWLN